MKPLNKLQTFILNAGGILLLIGALMPLSNTLTSYAPYVYTLGAMMFSTMQMMNSYTGKNTIIRRLRRQQLIGAVLLLVAGVLMFTSLFRVGPFQHDEWLMILTIATVFEVYTAFRLPAELDKEDK